MMCSAGNMWDSKSEGQSTSSTSTTELTESTETQHVDTSCQMTFHFRPFQTFSTAKLLPPIFRRNSYQCQNERPPSNEASNRGNSWNFDARSKQEQQVARRSGLVRFVPFSEVPQATRPRRLRQYRLEAESKWIKGSALAAASYRCLQWVYKSWKHPCSAPRRRWFYTINTINCINIINVNVINHKFRFNFNFWEWRFSTCTCTAQTCSTSLCLKFQNLRPIHILWYCGFKTSIERDASR